MEKETGMSILGDLFLRLFDRNGDGKVDWNDLPDWKIQESIFAALDTNKDGKVNFDDLSFPTANIAIAAKSISATAAAVGITATGAYASGLSIIGAKAALIGQGAATAAGVVSGYGFGAATASVYKTVKAIQISKAASYIGTQAGIAALNSGYSIPAAFTISEFVKTAAIDQLITSIAPQVASNIAHLKNVLTASSGAVSFVSELAAGKIAELPVVKAAATSMAVAKGEVIVIGGIAFSVQAAIILGLISVVVVGGYTYWLFNGGDKSNAKVSEGTPDVDVSAMA